MRLRRTLAVAGIALAFVLSPVAATFDLGASVALFFALIAVAASAAFWPGRVR